MRNVKANSSWLFSNFLCTQTQWNKKKRYKRYCHKKESHCLRQSMRWSPTLRAPEEMTWSALRAGHRAWSQLRRRHPGPTTPYNDWACIAEKSLIITQRPLAKKLLMGKRIQCVMEVMLIIPSR